MGEGFHVSNATLREESTGIKNVDVSSILRIQHLQRLATWASSKAQIAPLAAFLGERLAAKAEASGIPVDPSTFLCERCETILEPGSNCTIRIEKRSNKRKRSKKPSIKFQNNVIYYCNFCSHRNVKWGTRNGHVKGLLAARQGHTLKPDSSHSVTEIKEPSSTRRQLSKDSEPNSKHAMSGSVEHSATPMANLSCKKKNNKKKNGASAVAGNGSSSVVAGSEKETGGSSKRRRKGWLSLKQIVESNQSKNISDLSNFAIPFNL